MATAIQGVVSRATHGTPPYPTTRRPNRSQVKGSNLSSFGIKKAFLISMHQQKNATGTL